MKLPIGTFLFKWVICTKVVFVPFLFSAFMSLSPYELSIEESIGKTIQIWERDICAVTLDQKHFFSSVASFKDSELSRSNSGKFHKSAAQICFKEPSLSSNSSKINEVINSFAKVFPSISPALQAVVANTPKDVSNFKL